VASQPDRDGPVRAQLSALRSVLILSMLLTRQDDQASILDVVANAVGSLGPCVSACCARPDRAPVLTGLS
jgi:hypothetical protein